MSIYSMTVPQLKAEARAIRAEQSQTMNEGLICEFDGQLDAIRQLIQAKEGK